MPCHLAHTCLPSSPSPGMYIYAHAEDADLPDDPRGTPWLLGVLPVHRPCLATILLLTLTLPTLCSVGAHLGPQTTGGRRTLAPALELTLTGVTRGPQWTDSVISSQLASPLNTSNCHVLFKRRTWPAPLASLLCPVSSSILLPEGAAPPGPSAAPVSLAARASPLCPSPLPQERPPPTSFPWFLQLSPTGSHLPGGPPSPGPLPHAAAACAALRSTVFHALRVVVYWYLSPDSL